MSDILASIDEPIAISGGGIAGLTTALFFARAGVRSVLFEKASAFERLGAGIQLSPNAMHVLRTLDLEKAILETSVEPSGITIFSGNSGNEITTLPLGNSVREKFGAPYLLVHRADLQDVLVKACEDNPLIELRMANEVTTATQVAGGMALSVAEAGVKTETTAPLLIAADGVWSRLRRTLFNLPTAKFTGKIAWRSMLPASEVPDKAMLSRTSVWFGPHAHIVAYPVSSGDYLNLIVIVEGDAEEASSKLSGAQLMEKSGHWHQSARDLIAASDNWSGWPLFDHGKIETLANSHAALVGDAGHAMLPFAAQGGAMAIEDSAVLANSLENAASIEDGLKAYEAKRIDRVNRVMQLAHSNGKIYHHSGLVAFARNLTMRNTPPGLLMKRQDWIYGWRV